MTSSGRWAELYSSGLSDTDPRALLHKVAEEVQLVPKQIPLPVWFSDLPADFRLLNTSLTQPATQGGKAPWCLQMMFRRGANSIVVTARPVWAAPTLPPGDGPPHDQTCVTSNGTQLCASTPLAGQMMAEIGSADNFLSHFTALGSDPISWTTQVER
jgi:hypothetical protein